MKNRNYFQLQLFILIMFNQTEMFFCLTNDEIQDQTNQVSQSSEQSKHNSSKCQTDLSTETESSDPIISTAKKKRTYRKRSTTTSDSIRPMKNACKRSRKSKQSTDLNFVPNEKTSAILENSKFVLENTQPLVNIETISELISSSNKPKEQTVELCEISNKCDKSVHMKNEFSYARDTIADNNETEFQLTTHKYNIDAKYAHLQEDKGAVRTESTTTIKMFITKMRNVNIHKSPQEASSFCLNPLDKRRQVIFGVRSSPYMFSRFSFKFTPKYTPFNRQTLYRQIFDLRKTKMIVGSFKTTEKNRRTKSTAALLGTTLNVHQKNLNRFQNLYLKLISEERALNRSVLRMRENERLEREKYEAERAGSYLNKYVVREVTTESWEKDLPASSKTSDEQHMEIFQQRFNNEARDRELLEFEKTHILEKIEHEKKILEKMTKNMNELTTTNVVHSYYNDDVDSTEDEVHHKTITKQGKKSKAVKFHIGNEEEQDKSETRNLYKKQYHIKSPFFQKGTTTTRWTTHFHPNEYCRMMLDGWAQRSLKKATDLDKDKRKEEMMDIYEPDENSQHEIERLKTYEITSNPEFVHYLRDRNFSTDERVLNAIQWVDRDRFGRDGYVDAPHNLGTNSIMERPSYQARCLDYLSSNLIPGAKVLDLGFGSGFMSCCMARLVGDTGHVTAIEHIPQLVHNLQTKMKIVYPKLYKLLRKMDIIEWDARKPYKKNGPYDVIHFGGGVTYVPLEFIPDLKINGSILVPVGPPFGPHILKKITLIQKNIYTIQNLAEVEALHFCSSDEQVFDFRQTYGHHFIKLFSLFYKPIISYNETITNLLQTYKLPD